MPYQTVTTGMLNPEWVEMLMGLPTGWTNISGLRDQGRSNTAMNQLEQQRPVLIEQTA